jgi:hypothetical protein
MTATLNLSAHQSATHPACAELTLTIHNEDKDTPVKATWKVQLSEGIHPIAGSEPLSGTQTVHPGNTEQVGGWVLAFDEKQPLVEGEIEATSILQWSRKHITAFGNDRRMLSQMLQENVRRAVGGTRAVLKIGG